MIFYEVGILIAPYLNCLYKGPIVNLGGTVDLLKCSLLSVHEDLPSKYEISPILLNSAHIVSIKPINIVVAGNVIAGYWIRLTNGKKYKVVDVPEKIRALFGESDLELPVTQVDGNRVEDSEFIVQ